MKSSEQTQHAEVINARENIAKVFGSAPPAEQHHEREATASSLQNIQDRLAKTVPQLNEGIFAPNIDDKADDEKRVAEYAEYVRQCAQFIIGVGVWLNVERRRESAHTPSEITPPKEA